MIVWSGFGFLTAVFGILAVVAGEAVQPMLSGNGLPVMTGLAVGMLLAAVVNWVVGKGLNGRPGREMVDAKTGQHVILRRRHSLFWIPMQYFSVVFLVLAVAATAGLLDPAAPVPSAAQPT